MVPVVGARRACRRAGDAGAEAVGGAAHLQHGARAGQPDDIAGSVLYLASPAARYVTGTVLVVDGGYLAL